MTTRQRPPETTRRNRRPDIEGTGIEKERHLIWMALERLFPEGLLKDLPIRLKAAHLLHPQHRAVLIELVV